MINSLKMSFKIDFTYAINSFIYSLKRTPILKHIIKDSLYNKEGFKIFVRIIGIICSLLRLVVFKFAYFTVIYFIAKIIMPKSIDNYFIHLFFIFSIIGMFINTNILGTGKKKYFSVILFNMDAKKFMLSHFLMNSIMTFILNFIGLSFLCNKLSISLWCALLLSLVSLFTKAVGEALNIYYYKKNGFTIVNDKFIYFSVLIIGLLLAFGLPFLNIYFNNKIIFIFTIVSLIFSIISFIYMYRVKDYKLMYKKINTYKAIMNSDNSSEYSKQAMIDIKDKDKEINNKKIKNKKGYDLFNTIFFERHKYILLRSSNIYTIISLVIFSIFLVIIFEVPSYKGVINNFIMNNLGVFVIVMYFINRGAIVTRAMYFNCDHSMLTFNFYRDKDVILGLFKKRLITLIKVNLRPALAIGISLPILLFLTGGTSYIFNYLSIFIFIIFMSVFFSIHYLVIYYLLQPYNKNMEMKSITYSIISFFTYYVSYLCAKLTLSSTRFSILAILFTVIYAVIALFIVYKKAPDTFKIK